MTLRVDGRNRVTAMHERHLHNSSPRRPDPAGAIPDDQARALERRHSLDEQQRKYQGNAPSANLLRRRPPC